MLGSILVVGVAALVAWLALAVSDRGPAAVGQSCPTVLRVVTAASFVPVVTGVAPASAEGPDCVRLDVAVADRRGATGRLAEPAADVWIPDDVGWAGSPGPTRLAATPAAGAGTVLAESPFCLVTDAATATRVTDAGGGWLSLADLVTGEGPDPVHLAVGDPGGTGDGMLGAGAVAEAVWVRSGMDTSAEALATALPRTCVVTGAVPGLSCTCVVTGEGPDPVHLAVRDPGGTGDGMLGAGAVAEAVWVRSGMDTSDEALATALPRTCVVSDGVPGLSCTCVVTGAVPGLFCTCVVTGAVPALSRTCVVTDAAPRCPARARSPTRPRAAPGAG